MSGPAPRRSYPGAMCAPTSTRRTPALERTTRRWSRTVGTVLIGTGLGSTAVVLGIGEKYSGGWVVLDWILMIALVVMVITFAIGAFWSAAVLLRQLVVRPAVGPCAPSPPRTGGECLTGLGERVQQRSEQDPLHDRADHRPPQHLKNSPPGLPPNYTYIHHNHRSSDRPPFL